MEKNGPLLYNHPMNIREMLEARERETLSPHASLAVNSRLSRIPRDEDDLRTVYMHDRDRIIHSEYFRRLKDKTQVILSAVDGAYRTRLTHTLEVTQIARTIARALRLNEDLTEAIGLGHDLGHTPFGHSGEKAINRIIGGGFHHSRQSLRVVDVLERGGGLNLTEEVRDGILNHTKGKGRMIDESRYPLTIEAEIVRVCDSIAYVNHDIDDAIRYGILSADELPASTKRILGTRYSERIDTMVRAVIIASIEKPHIAMAANVMDASEELRAFMFSRVYESPAFLADVEEACAIVKDVFEYFTGNPAMISRYFKGAPEGDDLTVRIIDCIAYQTDREMMTLHKRIRPSGVRDENERALPFNDPAE